MCLHMRVFLCRPLYAQLMHCWEGAHGFLLLGNEVSTPEGVLDTPYPFVLFWLFSDRTLLCALTDRMLAM